MSEAVPAGTDTAIQLAASFQEETFGDYRLTHLLGKGGMASVYRAVRSGPMGFAKQMAIKRLHSNLTDNDQVLKALINEARLGGQLKHPNIVEVYEFNKVGEKPHETYFLAMEFVDGWTLDRITKLATEVELPVPVEVVLDIVIQICEGLHYAHTVESLDGQEVKLVHRDLKPANIILGRDGVAKVMDFGIAKAATNLFKTTMADTTKGTPHYMSPEQVAGNPNLDATSDIFAMGSVLYELLMGKVLFTGESLVAVLFAVARAEADEACELVELRLHGLGDVLRRCLQKDPSERYQTAQELKRALQRLRDACPGDATIKSYLYALRDRMLHGRPDPQDDEEGPEFATLLARDWVTVDARARQELADTKRAADEAVQEMAGRPVRVDGGGDAFGETVAAPTSTAGSPAPKRRSKGATPAAISPSASTRPNLRPTAVYTKADTPDQRRRRTIAAIAGTLLVGIAGVLGWLEFGPKEAEPEPTPVAALTPPPVEFGDLAVEATPTPTPAPRSTPADRTPARPRPTPTPPPVADATATPLPVAAPIATPPPQPTPEAVAVLGKGTLKIKACKPWAKVSIDGRDTGKQTPVFEAIPLAAGKHTIELYAVSLQARVSKTITIEADKVFVLSGYDFEQKNWIK